MRNAIILARVSTPEQEAGHSLEAQLANLQSYAERKGLNVVQVFRIIESSTKGYRPEFERMIDFLTKQKSRHALIVDCVDRLQRSFTHTPVLNSLMEKNLLEIHFVREGNVIDKDANSMQKMMWNMGTVMAQSYTDQLSDNVRRSIKHKLEKGEWIAQAPLGYLNETDPATGRGIITIDPQRAPLVQKLFNDYASGVFSMAELARKTQEWGLLSRKSNKPLSIQTVACMLSNPFYSGLMRIKGKLYPHAHPVLIEPSVFQACERRKRHAGKPQQAIRITRQPFLLRGLITLRHLRAQSDLCLSEEAICLSDGTQPSQPEQNHLGEGSNCYPADYRRPEIIRHASRTADRGIGLHTENRRTGKTAQPC
jgi:site-specific DNA recombinase